MRLENLPKTPNCTACGDKLTEKNWSLYDGDVKSRCKYCQSEFIRERRYEKIHKKAYQHVACLNALEVSKRPLMLITMIRNKRIKNEIISEILREVDFGRDVKEKVWTTKEEDR